MSKSSSMHGETMASATASEFSDLATKSKPSVDDETSVFTSSSPGETTESDTSSEYSNTASEYVDVDMSKAYVVDDATEFTSSSPKETVKSSSIYEFSDSAIKKFVVRLDFGSQKDHKLKKVMKSVSSLSGIESIAMDKNKSMLTIYGDCYPVALIEKIRKHGYAELVSIGPAREPEKLVTISE